MDHQTIGSPLAMLARVLRGGMGFFALRGQCGGAYHPGLFRTRFERVPYVLAGFSLGLALNAYALKPSFQGDPSYLIDYWETEDGLPENSATAMVQTADGYLWFGTFNGLVRFDGVKFNVFNQQNTPQLPSSSIVNLHLDKHGRLWISTYGGLVIHEGTHWDVLTREVVNTGDIIRTFAERPDGDLLLTKFSGKVVEFSNGRLRDLPPPPGDPHGGYQGEVDETGQWWVVQNKFIGSWNGNKWVPVPLALDVSSLAADQFGCARARDGGLWIILGAELLKYSRGVEVGRIHLSETPGGVWSMNEDRQGNVWISTHDKGVCRVSPKGQMQRWNEANGLPYHGVRFVFEDGEADLWVGTSGGGLARFKPRRFQNFGTESGLSERVVKSVWPAPDGGLWIATYGKGLFRFGDAGITNVPIPGWGADLLGQSVLTDTTGRTWVGTLWRGLWLMDRGEVRRIPAEQAGGENVIALFEDSSSRVWTSGGEAVSAFTAGIPHRYMPVQRLPPPSVRCFGEDRSRTVWLSNLEGVFRLENDRFVEVRDSESHPIRDILCIKGDADGRLWMGSLSAGLLCWSNGSLSKVSANAGLPVSSIQSILEDGLGFFWMTSNRGIVRAHRKDLAAAADGKRSRVVCQVLDLSDGLPSVEFPSGQPACACDGSGRLWFATTKGVAVTDPVEFQLHRHPLAVQIEEVTYHIRSEHASETGRRAAAPLPDHLELPAGSTRIEIHYTAPCFTAPEKVRFEVKLKGQDATWQDVGNRRVVYFDELRPGKHLFLVRACNSDGVWNETEASLAFAVLPLFWQTAWFRTLEWSAALIEGLLILALVRAMARRRRAKLALRERLDFEQLVSELSGTFINMPLEKIHGQITEGLGKVARQLGFDAASLAVFKRCAAEDHVTFLWRAEGVAENLPKFSKESFPWSSNELFQGREVCLPSLQGLPAEAMVDRAAYARSGVRSVYQVPLSAEGAPLGSLSFCTVCTERALPAELLQRQRLVGEVFANALIRELTENRRRESEARFRIVADAAPVLIWMSGVDKLCTFFNKTWLDFTGRTMEQELGNGWADGVHPQDLPGCLKTYLEAFDARQPFVMQYRLRRHDGEYRWVSDNGVPRHDAQGTFAGYIGSCADITELRASEQALRESEERMSLAAEAANLGMWMRDMRSNQIWATQKWRELYGFARGAEITFETFLQRVYPDDREAVRQAVRRSQNQKAGYFVEYRLLLPEGTRRWIAARGRTEFDENETPLRMLGVSIDITQRRRTEEEAREVSGRLITAQEDERTRLARELHDDLSQSLALLSVDLDLFGQQQSAEMGDSARGRMEELATQVRSLSSEVHRLSHELHPSKLEQLGLIAAVRSFCKDIMAAHKLAIQFEARDLPRVVPDAVSLCLYRVAQEAVHNVVKHSGATHVHVELNGWTSGLRLTISDDGVGFDLERARANGSLGLVSMRERVRVVHGELSLNSKKGEGTRVEAQVPV
jgi:PAS domain S-box-containing protein